MKDEIKSFLVQIKGNDEWKEIYNYITNLQEENRQTKLLKERYQLEKEVYKSRCEKAREMIKFIAFNSERPLTTTELNKVYNILKGSDKE